ncbi:MAG TPA: hypothetical protein VFH51_16945, partial [Myxococcota bacterium]|nr:hypothetical protein [Myxococcota bacterium]
PIAPSPLGDGWHVVDRQEAAPPPGDRFETGEGFVDIPPPPPAVRAVLEEAPELLEPSAVTADALCQSWVGLTPLQHAILANSSLAPFLLNAATRIAQQPGDSDARRRLRQMLAAAIATSEVHQTFGLLAGCLESLALLQCDAWQRFRLHQAAGTRPVAQTRKIYEDFVGMRVRDANRAKPEIREFVAQSTTDVVLVAQADKHLGVTLPTNMIGRATHIRAALQRELDKRGGHRLLQAMLNTVAERGARAQNFAARVVVLQRQLDALEGLLDRA